MRFKKLKKEPKNQQSARSRKGDKMKLVEKGLVSRKQENKGQAGL